MAGSLNATLGVFALGVILNGFSAGITGSFAAALSAGIDTAEPIEPGTGSAAFIGALSSSSTGSGSGAGSGIIIGSVAATLTPFG